MNKHLALFIIHSVLAVACLSVGIAYATIGQYFLAGLAAVGTGIPIVCAINAYEDWIN